MLSVQIASKVAQAIVNHQRDIIGPLAFEQAGKVPGIVVSQSTVSLQESLPDPANTLVGLVHKYEELFGQTSVEVCKDAVKELGSAISSKDLPAILQ
ncbi:MAG: hypothetical protein ABI758_02325 [Candidatus Woesebacteria bacterium]